MDIYFDNKIAKKLCSLTREEEKMFIQATKPITVFTRDTKPNLPTHLLELYEELKEYNLVHNDELKKIIEARNEKK